MSSRDAAMRYSVLLVLGGILAGFEIGSTGAAQVASAHGAAATAPAVTFTIRLFTLDDVRRLDQRAEIAEVIDTARAYSDSPIFLAAYVTADDVRSNRADATGVADELVIEIGGYLASRGVEPDRISGKGMGIDPAIGRAVVVSFGSTAPPLGLGPRALQVVRKGPQAYNQGIERFGNIPILIRQILPADPAHKIPAFTQGLLRARL